MPRLTTPPDFPEGVRIVIEILGSQIRTEIVRRLATPMSTTELATDLGLDRASVHRHLLALEEHGYVTADVSLEGRSRRRTPAKWSSNPEKVREAAERWRDYMLGSSD